MKKDKDKLKETNLTVLKPGRETYLLGKHENRFTRRILGNKCFSLGKKSRQLVNGSKTRNENHLKLILLNNCDLFNHPVIGNKIRQRE